MIITHRLAHRFPHCFQPCKMNAGIKGIFLEQAIQRVLVQEINFPELQSCRFTPRDFFHSVQGVLHTVDEVVYHHDLSPGLEELAAGVGANVACSTCVCTKEREGVYNIYEIRC